MKIKTIDDAIKIIIETSIIHSVGSTNGESGKANRNIEKRHKIFLSLKEKGHLYDLVPLLGHEASPVKLFAAQVLLWTDYHEQAVETLKILEKTNCIESINAEYTLMSVMEKSKRPNQ